MNEDKLEQEWSLRVNLLAYTRAVEVVLGAFIGGLLARYVPSGAAGGWLILLAAFLIAMMVMMVEGHFVHYQNAMDEKQREQIKEVVLEALRQEIDEQWRTKR
jgi:purine-cytosine permease-like protein